ncbi:hypothetical protein K435DRAFT_799851 [Dendrothele bispora CBS 962.96]|uniref:Uncharacterized protein n=1 Tax=Dendrothele bispora (strain CBS 962.96) TaxID=1314807 RepID=A0A4S8LV29_DENBC|nr:hypothetical protein K435DRAFT_799851 [Dendrothele bispora CBS 962.96]
MIQLFFVVAASTGISPSSVEVKGRELRGRVKAVFDRTKNERRRGGERKGKKRCWSLVPLNVPPTSVEYKVNSLRLLPPITPSSSLVPPDSNNGVSQKLKDLTETWDGDMKREKEKDSCGDQSEKETKITQRLLVKARETSLMMCQEI